MKNLQYLLAAIIILVVFSSSMSIYGFRAKQIKNERVAKAYYNKSEKLKRLLRVKELNFDEIEIVIHVFKNEKVLEVFARNFNDSIFKYFISYKMCELSGVLGPKRKQGDEQVPEGFYHIDRFNPWSNYHLSLGLNYPNESDKIISKAKDKGGDIFIHGGCLTIGCIPIRDDKIEELYILCVNAIESGQNEIPVIIYPTKLNDKNFESLKLQYSENQEFFPLWEDLHIYYKNVYLKSLYKEISFLENGRCKLNK